MIGGQRFNDLYCGPLMHSQEGFPFDAGDCRRLLACEGYLELGMTVEAEAELNGIPPKKRNLPAPSALKLSLCQQTGAWQPMRDIARRLAKAQPSEAQWWISWAYAARRTESLAKALKILRRSLDLHGKEAIIHFNLACYLAQLGQIDEARQSLRAAIRLNEDCRRMAREEADLAPLRNVF
jgi:tetratricopeptide (TPR) repeat protein